MRKMPTLLSSVLLAIPSRCVSKMSIMFLESQDFLESLQSLDHWYLYLVSVLSHQGWVSLVPPILVALVTLVSGGRAGCRGHITAGASSLQGPHHYRGQNQEARSGDLEGRKSGDQEVD